MKKTGKRMLALLLVFVLSFSAICLSSLAESEKPAATADEIGRAHV